MHHSLHLVTWNGAKYIPYLFESLRKQTNKDWHLFILDNGSTDNTVELIRAKVASLGISYTLFSMKENMGFAAGHNRLFKESNAALQGIINQDLYLEPHCLELLFHFADAHQKFGALAPRLMKWDFSSIGRGFDSTRTDTIDALGMRVFRSRRILEQYSGVLWKLLEQNVLQNKNDISVFGVSGAMALFRKEALQEVAFSDGTIFDESYGSYKEDVDLAFRLVSQGFGSAIVLNAVAYHDRSSAGPATTSDMNTAKNKRMQKNYVRYQSYKNHLITLYKNEYWQNFLLDFPWIFWYEVKKFVWLLIFDQGTLCGLIDIWKMKEDLCIKKLHIKNKRKASWKEIRRWWTESCNQITNKK